MKNTTLSSALLACLAGAALLAATPAAADPDADLQQFLAHADAPVSSFRFQSISNFKALPGYHLAVWNGATDVWLLKLRRPCPGFGPDLKALRSISLNNTHAKVFALRDGTVSVGSSECWVESIRPVDYAAMRAAEKDAQG